MCVPLSAEYISEEEYARQAYKLYSWEKDNCKDSLLRLRIRSNSMLKSLVSYSQSHEYAIPADDNNKTYIKKILVIAK